MAADAAAPYVRVTVLGGRRNADLVLPSDHAIALLLPGILDTVGAPDGTVAYELVTTAGHVLAPQATLAEADLRDGVEVRLVARAQAPPAPIVYDLVEVLDRVTPPGVWGPAPRRWVLSLIAATTWAAAAWIMVGASVGEAPRIWVAAAAAATIVSGAAAVLGARETGWSFGALGVLAAAVAVTAGGWQRPWWWCLVLTLTVVIAGWCTRRVVAAAVTVGVGAALAAVVSILTRVLSDAAGVASVTATAALFLLGILPRAALAVAGVFALDTQVGAGRRLPRRDALARVAEAHWALAGGVAAAALVLGGALHVVALARPGPWTVALTLVLVVAVALRARHFPLAAERAVLWLAALSGVLGLVRAGLGVAPQAAAVVLAAACAGVVLLLAAAHSNPGDLRAAQLRKGATAVETALMLASVPVVVGVFGVYGDLLATFRG